VPTALNTLSNSSAVMTGLGKGGGSALGAIKDPLVVLPSLMYAITAATACPSFFLLFPPAPFLPPQKKHAGPVVVSGVCGGVWWCVWLW
jgi:hypothetical protein